MNKILMSLTILTVSCFNMFAQTSSFISDCDNFVDGPNENWPYVLVATTVADSIESQGSQTFSMNISSLPDGGANFRVYKTTANGNDYFGNPVSLTLGLNIFTVNAVTFDRAVKFQFSSGDIEFIALSLNEEDSDCVDPLPTPSSSLIRDCGDFVSGPSAWPYVLIATTIADSTLSQESQSFTMNVISLPEDGASYRVYKTTANGNDYFGNPIALSLGENTITVSAVNFDRAVKFQFSSGDVEFDALSLNEEDTDCVTNSSSMGIYTIDTKFKINLFPNPTSDNLTISLEGIDNVNISIINSQGKILTQESCVFDKDKIDLSNYQSGIYFVKIMTSDESKQLRFIKL
tara:strand:+ start:1336 stop:2376 length:1041 start_codon:yes stop_codon:yes gene_type:complete